MDQKHKDTEKNLQSQGKENSAPTNSQGEPHHVAPTGGELRGDPGIRRGGSDVAATGSGLRPKSGVSGTDRDGQVTDQ